MAAVNLICLHTLAGVWPSASSATMKGERRGAPDAGRTVLKLSSTRGRPHTVAHTRNAPTRRASRYRRQRWRHPLGPLSVVAFSSAVRALSLFSRCTYARLMRLVRRARTAAGDDVPRWLLAARGWRDVVVARGERPNEAPRPDLRPVSACNITMYSDNIMIIIIESTRRGERFCPTKTPSRSAHAFDTRTTIYYSIIILLFLVQRIRSRLSVGIYSNNI